MKILENSILLRLKFEKPGNLRKGDKSKIATDADKDRLKLSKTLFDCKQFEAVGTFDNELRTWITSRAIQADVGFSGVYILPIALLTAVEERLKIAADERAATVAKFMAVYDDERTKARERLADQFKESDYPDAGEIERKFGFSWRYVTFDVPEKLPPEIREREMKAREDSFKDMETQCRLAMREGLAELLGHLTDRLTPDASGKKKIFRDSAVSNIVEFLDLLKARDITDDSALRDLADKAKEIIKDATPERLRNSDSLQQAIAGKLAAVKSGIDGLIETETKRKFNLED